MQNIIIWHSIAYILRKKIYPINEYDKDFPKFFFFFFFKYKLSTTHNYCGPMINKVIEKHKISYSNFSSGKKIPSDFF